MVLQQHAYTHLISKPSCLSKCALACQKQCRATPGQVRTHVVLREVACFTWHSLDTLLHCCDSEHEFCWQFFKYPRTAVGLQEIASGCMLHDPQGALSFRADSIART